MISSSNNRHFPISFIIGLSICRTQLLHQHFILWSVGSNLINNMLRIYKCHIQTCVNTNNQTQNQLILTISYWWTREWSIVNTTSNKITKHTLYLTIIIPHLYKHVTVFHLYMDVTLTINTKSIWNYNIY